MSLNNRKLHSLESLEPRLMMYRNSIARELPVHHVHSVADAATTISLIGDSITAGIDSVDAAVKNQEVRSSYRPLLWDYIREDAESHARFVGGTFYNSEGLDPEARNHSSFRGYTSSNFLPARRGFGADPHGPVSIVNANGWATFGADVAVLLVGTNDLMLDRPILGTHSIESSIRDMISALRVHNEGIDILLGTVPPVDSRHAFSDRVPALNEVLKAFPEPELEQEWLGSTEDSPIIIVDHFGGIEGLPVFNPVIHTTPDGIHPNELGDAILAGNWWSTLESVLENQPDRDEVNAAAEPTESAELDQDEANDIPEESNTAANGENPSAENPIAEIPATETPIADFPTVAEIVPELPAETVSEVPVGSLEQPADDVSQVSAPAELIPGDAAPDNAEPVEAGSIEVPSDPVELTDQRGGQVSDEAVVVTPSEDNVETDLGTLELESGLEAAADDAAVETVEDASQDSTELSPDAIPDPITGDAISETEVDESQAQGESESQGDGEAEDVRSQGVDAVVAQPSENQLPVITIEPEQASVLESERLRFRITRDGNLESSLVLRLLWGGSATNGVDFVGGRRTIIPAGVDQVFVELAVLDDGAAESSETITLTTRPTAYYNVEESAALATITDTPPPAPDDADLALALFLPLY